METEYWAKAEGGIKDNSKILVFMLLFSNVEIIQLETLDKYQV